MAISDEVLVAFDRNPGAAGDPVNSFAKVFGFDPPPGYLEFMRRSNGGEGFVSKRYLMLWPVEELRQHNDGYEVARYAPGLFLFGSDGGGEAYAFDLREATPTIVSVPFVGMSLREATHCGSDFDEFLQGLAKD